MRTTTPLYFGPLHPPAHMMGGGWPGWPSGIITPAEEKKDEPQDEGEPVFNPKPPTTRAEADDRVAFVHATLTKGEKHQLYKLFHDTDRIRLEDCLWRMQEMRDGFVKAAKAKGQAA